MMILARIAARGLGTSAHGVSPSIAPAIEILTNIAHWKLSPTPPALEKDFVFRDAATARRFLAQAEDLRSRAKRAFRLDEVVSAPPPAASVRVSIPAAAADGVVGDAEASLASACDDIGAHLQLAGKWG